MRLVPAYYYHAMEAISTERKTPIKGTETTVSSTVYSLLPGQHKPIDDGDSQADFDTTPGTLSFTLFLCCSALDYPSHARCMPIDPIILAPGKGGGDCRATILERPDKRATTIGGEED